MRLVIRTTLPVLVAEEIKRDILDEWGKLQVQGESEAAQKRLGLDSLYRQI